MNTKRTDIHRPGVIIPADYSLVLMYSLAHQDNGFPMPPLGVNCVTEHMGYADDGSVIRGTHHGERCCVERLRENGSKFVQTGGLGKCSVCGASFLHGSVWVHDATGEHLFIGHQCADKYELMADWSSRELRLDRLHRQTAREIAVEQNRVARAAFLSENPGLEEALATEHRIIADIAARFRTQCHLSPKQVALVMKLHNEIVNPAPKTEEKHAAAPTGRVTFTGEVVSAREHDTQFGTSLKITVKVTTADGATWLAWGTAPRNVLAEAAGKGGVRGCTVEITATLKQGRDAHFALMSRPNGRVVAARAA